MEATVYLLEFGLVNVRIDLGGGYIGVTEQFLHDPQVRPPAQKVGGKTMPQGVR